MLYRVRGPACKDLCVPYCVHVDWSKEPRLSKPPFSHQMEGVKDPILSAYGTNLLKQQECAVCDSWCGGDPWKMIASVKRLGGSQGGHFTNGKMLIWCLRPSLFPSCPSIWSRPAAPFSLPHLLFSRSPRISFLVPGSTVSHLKKKKRHF